MNTISMMLHAALPLLGMLIMLMGIKLKRINYLVTSLWISLIAIVLHYQSSDGEILGVYFDYKNAVIYTINIFVLVVTLFYLFFKHPILQGKIPRYLSEAVSVCLVIGGLFLLVNIWVNAHFIETRRPGTVILQVATFSPLTYCTYRYLFYKVGSDGSIRYMCPNYYGIVPSIGQLQTPPAFVMKHLAQKE